MNSHPLHDSSKTSLSNRDMQPKELSNPMPKVKEPTHPLELRSDQAATLTGKIARQSPKTTSNSAAQTRLNRRNHAKQTQTKKRSEIVSASRLFNGVDGAPRIVAVVPLCPDVSSKNIVFAIAASLGVFPEDCSENGIWKMKSALICLLCNKSSNRSHCF